MKSFGLYFGATNTCLAVWKDGHVEVLANDAGDRVTPAIVSFASGEKIVGLAAKQQLSRNATNTVCYVKRLILDNEVPCNEDLDGVKTECKVILENGVKYEIENGGKSYYYSVHDILVLIFQKMLDIAKSHGSGDDCYPTVLAVPLYFTSTQKKIIRDAATKAGFKILRIISEPSSALLAYNVGQDHSHFSCNCLVYRMGGTSMDVTVIAVLNGMYRIISHVRRHNLGGNRLTKLLFDYCADEFKRQYRTDIRESKRSVYKLNSAVETCKTVLTNMGAAHCFVESLYDGLDFSSNISRARFESLMNNILQECLEPIEEAISRSSFKKEEIHKVIIVGGCSKIPRVQQVISDMFSSAEILTSLSPDEVIALGAASEAALLISEEEQDESELEYEIDTLSQSIYIKTAEGNDKLLCFIPSGTPVPTKHHQTFHLTNLQNSVCVQLYEGPKGCEKNAEQASLLAKLVLNDIPANAEISLSLHIKNDGSLHAVCTEKSHNKSESLLIEAA